VASRLSRCFPHSSSSSEQKITISAPDEPAVRPLRPSPIRLSLLSVQRDKIDRSYRNSSIERPRHNFRPARLRITFVASRKGPFGTDSRAEDSLVVASLIAIALTGKSNALDNDVLREKRRLPPPARKGLQPLPLDLTDGH